MLSSLYLSFILFFLRFAGTSMQIDRNKIFLFRYYSSVLPGPDSIFSIELKKKNMYLDPQVKNKMEMLHCINKTINYF